MFIFNLAFLAEPANEKSLSRWLREVLFPQLKNFTSEGRILSELRVLEIENQPDYADEMLNISIQIPFATLEEARAWGARNIPAFRSGAAEKFGEHVMLFATILSKETIAL